VFEGMGIRLLVAGSCVAVAIVSALAISAYRWTLPLAVLPLLILRQVLAGHFQARHDHTRMLGLFNAALDANRPLVDGEPLEEILRSARTLLRCPLAVVRADPPGMAELGAEILVAGEAHWLVVSGRGHSEPFDAADKNLLKALAAVGVGALTNAQLYREGQFQRERLAAITASLGDGVCALDRSGRVTFTNPAALTMLGWDSFPGVTPNFLAGPAHAAMQSPAAIQREDAHLQRPDGTSMPVALTASPILHEGRVAGAVIVFRDISERRAAETAVRVARDQAIEASRLKSQFLANMSHEIRTPMNGVLGLSRMLLDTPVDETQRKYLLALRDCGENLMVIINDVLDFSKIEAGKLDLEEVNFDPAASLASVTNALTVPANEKGLLLRLHVDPQLHGEVSGDPVRLRQVLTNLVGNAIKFTPSGSVTVTALALDGARMRVLVTDTGIGIDPSARGAVLGAFGQADASTTRRYGGTGLGLAICCHLVGMMGGVLDFVSEPGNGSTFWFEVPLRPPNHGGETEAPDPAEHPAEPRAEPPVAASPIETPADAPRALRRILIADDAPVNLLVTSREVEQLGYEVVVTTNGQEALEAVQRGRYDAVLMDCLMPVMDGYEATRRIRELEGAVGATPIIAMTASAMVGDREECLLAGMDDYLSKPLRRDVLAATLERATRATGTGKP
jgi:signal transduction histidine kinase/CheY-like chemotaxis protein